MAVSAYRDVSIDRIVLGLQVRAVPVHGAKFLRVILITTCKDVPPMIQLIRVKPKVTQDHY